MGTKTKQHKVESSSPRTHQDKSLAELEKYRILVENVQDYAIFLLDKDGCVQTWNKGAEKNKGYKPHEIIGKHFSTFYLQRDKDANKPARELEIAQKFGRVEDEDWRVRKDGSRFWANVVITALYNDDKELVGYAKVTRDLTERKHHEDSLRDANELLNQQQRELEHLNMLKDEFISLASHQLRTPATVVKQFLGMLLEGFKGEVPPEQLPLLQKAYANNERQIAIVNDLLKVAQIDAGKIKLRKTVIDLTSLVNEVVDQQMVTFKNRNQSIVIKPTTRAPKEAYVDPEYIRMVLENLLDNASKYTPDGGRVTVSIDHLDNIVRLKVQDSGVGIAAQDREKLFTKFSRIPNALSDKVGGTGLGLYWIDKVVSLHGGEINVHSQVDKGSIFTVLIPVSSQNA